MNIDSTAVHTLKKKEAVYPENILRKATKVLSYCFLGKQGKY